MSDESNLTNITEGRKKKAKSKIVMGSKTVVKEEFEGDTEKPAKPRKKKYATMEKILSGWIDGDESFVGFSFGTTYKVVIPTDFDAARIIIKINEKNNTAQFVTDKDVAGTLHRAIDRPSMWESDYDITYRQCLEVAQCWVETRTESCPEPKSIVFLSDPELAYARLEFDPLPETAILWPATAFPILNAALTRMTNADAFCARVGSMFDPKADRKQGIWLCGEGDGGKSFWQDVLSYLAGGRHAVADLNPGIMRSDHWKSALIGKNLILVREAKPEFILGDDFKSLLGDSMHSVNPKNRPIFSTMFKCFALFASNEMPCFPKDSGIENRVIVCKVQPVPEDERLESSVLWERVKPELQAFVSYCLAVYKANGSGKIKVEDNSAVEEAIEMYESHDWGIFDALFELDPNSSVPSTKFRTVLQEYGIVGNGAQLKFGNFLKRQFPGIVIFGDKEGPKHQRVRVIRGLKLKVIPLS